MHRWTARFLALVMLVPAFGPLALARASQTMGPHCMRQPAQAMMQCHPGMAMTPEPQSPDKSFDAADSCCQDHSCCRGLATPRWAKAESSLLSTNVFLAERTLPASGLQFSPFAVSDTDSARAPPQG